MRLRLILRLLWAFIFATFALIYSELIPQIPGAHPTLVRAVVTVFAAWVGYIIFPDFAHWIKLISLTTSNFFVHRVSQELMNQLMRLPRARLPFGFAQGQQTPQIGSVQLTRPLILDTSSIIDGRILDIAKTGFIGGLILVPNFVLTELQQVSDSKDDLKRQRGRRGFQTVEELKKLKSLRLEIWDKQQSGTEVDDKLISLAKSLHGKILTTDFNLNKVATLSNIQVLNINDLANAVKTITIPGESLEIKVVHLGKDSNQGVGYLPDGTMAVVTDAADSIGKTIKIETTKTIQIPQGRMIFGKKIN
ncbi:MAG: hypothetical protein AAB414_05020 [Patescibacteria group bacterium]